MPLYVKLKNAFLALSGNVLGIPFQLLGFILAARCLGATQYGAYIFALEYSGIFAACSEGGFGQLANRELAKNPKQKGVLVGSFFVLKLLLGGTVYILAVSVAPFWTHTTQEFITVTIVGFSSVLLVSTLLLYGILRAFNRMDLEGIVAFLQPACYVSALGVLSLISTQSVNTLWVAGSFFFSTIVAVGFGFLCLRRLSPERWSINWQLMRTLIRQAVPLGIAYVLSTTYLRTVFFFLRQYVAPEEMAYFSVAFNLVFNLNIVPSVVCGAWMASLTWDHMYCQLDFLKQAMQLLLLLFLGSLVGVAVLTPLGSAIITLLFSNEYLPARPLFQKSIFLIISLWVGCGLQTVFTSIGRQSLWTWLLAVGAGVNLLGCYLLIPRFGLDGAVWSLLCAGLISLVCGIAVFLRVVASPRQCLRAVLRAK